jgi:hypothetical protein
VTVAHVMGGLLVGGGVCLALLATWALLDDIRRRRARAAASSGTKEDR